VNNSFNPNLMMVKYLLMVVTAANDDKCPLFVESRSLAGAKNSLKEATINTGIIIPVKYFFRICICL
jgi:hypothetical protein